MSRVDDALARTFNTPESQAFLERLTRQPQQAPTQPDASDSGHGDHSGLTPQLEIGRASCRERVSIDV